MMFIIHSDRVYHDTRVARLICTSIPNLSSIVIEWITQYAGKPEFSCIGFAYFCLKHIRIEKIDSWTIIHNQKPTCIIELNSSSNKRDFHFAVRLDDDRYLSQWGNGGVIVISSLTEMHTFFQTDTIQWVSDISPDTN